MKVVCRQRDRIWNDAGHWRVQCGLTIIRRKNPAFNYGFFRPNPLALEHEAGKNAGHGGEFTDPGNSEQAEIARSTAHDFLRLVKNMHVSVLLSRGMRGCHVYFVRRKTENLSRSRVEAGHHKHNR